MYTLNEQVVKEFELSVPKFYRSRVLDVLMIKYLIDEAETLSQIPSVRGEYYTID